MKTRFGLALCAMLAATALSGTKMAHAADFIMKVSSPAPETPIDPLSAWFRAFEKGVEEKSGGRIDVQFFPASQLGPIPATVEGTVMGTIEMTMPAIGFLVGLDPRFQVFDAEGLFDSELHALKTLSDPAVRAMMADFGAKAGVEPLAVWPSGQMIIVSKDPITTVDEMKGKKIRSAGATTLVIKPFEALGIGPVAMPLGDVLPGIQTGQIDGATINLPVAIGFKYADVAKNVLYMPKKFAIIGGLVNTGFLKQIGPELEAIVREEALAANEAFIAKLETAPKAMEGLWTGKMGGTVTTLSAEEEAKYLATTGPVIEEVVAGDATLKSVYDTLKAAADANR